MNTSAPHTPTTLTDIISKIVSQGDKPDLSFLKDNPQAQSMLLLALLQTGNSASTDNNATTTTTAANSGMSPQLLNQLISSLSSTVSQTQLSEQRHGLTPPPHGSQNIAKEDKSTKKKVGRRPVTSDEDNSDDPKLKRKAQNRAAQRAFRERKENQVRLLEDKVKQLEATLGTDKNTEQLALENKKLKDMIAELQRENELIKASTTSFDIPLTASLKDTDGERPNKLVRQNVASFRSTPPNDRVSHSPEVEDEKNGKSNRRSNSKSSSSSNSSSDIGNIMITPEMTIDDILNLDPTTSAMTTPSASSLSMLPISNSIFSANELFGVPQNNTVNTGISNSMDYSKQLNDLLMEHRTTLSTDPTQFDFFYPLPTNMNLNANDSTTAATTVQVPAPTTATDTAATTMPAMFDTAVTSAPTASSSAADTTAKEDVAAYKTENITNVWNKLAEHPRFSEFDLDLLCDEMKHKAVCTESCQDTTNTHEKELLSLVEKHYPVNSK